MNVVPYRLHSVREFLGVRDEAAVFVPLACHPRVVEDQVHVARVTHAGGHHCVGDCLNLLLVNLFFKRIPTVPAHRRRQGKVRARIECLGQGVADKGVVGGRTVVMAVPVAASTQILIVKLFSRQMVLFSILNAFLLFLVPVGITHYTKFLKASVPEVGGRHKGNVLERWVISHSFLGLAEFHHGNRLVIILVLGSLCHLMTTDTQLTNHDRHVGRIEVLAQVAKHGREIVRVALDEAHTNAFAVQLEMPLAEVIPTLEPGHPGNLVTLPFITGHHILDVGQAFFDF
ncbi:hypothetical protein ES703_118072 [subsurface metagenome]